MNMVFIVALLHGVPVFFFGVRSRSRAILTILAIISGGIALVTGNSRFNGADLTAVVLAWVLGMLVLNSIAVARPRDENAERIKSAEQKAGLKKAFLTLSALCVAFIGMFGAIIYYNKTHGPCSDDELMKQQVTFQQCRTNEEIKNCQAGNLAACRSIEAKRLRYRESREPEYRE